MVGAGCQGDDFVSDGVEGGVVHLLEGVYLFANPKDISVANRTAVVVDLRQCG